MRRIQQGDEHMLVPTVTVSAVGLPAAFRVNTDKLSAPRLMHPIPATFALYC